MPKIAARGGTRQKPAPAQMMLLNYACVHGFVEFL
jgi:hypothetical protein